MIMKKQIKYCKDVDIKVDAIPMEIPKGVFCGTLQVD